MPVFVFDIPHPSLRATFPLRGKVIMIRRLYDWVINLASHRRAIPAMGAVSFLESSFFPIPPDVMLVPMVLARRDKAWTIATVCTVASVLGGLLGYAIGYYLFETIGAWVVKLYSLQGALDNFRLGFEKYGVWIILIKGLTPIPYKLVTIASGAAHFDLFTFVWASIVTRGARFFLVAWLLWQFGEPIRAFIEKRLTLLTWLFLIALIGGFVAFRYLF
jgi:membrane protein YqaA with SNARE-associated domain